jgi:hypothetical protein
LILNKQILKILKLKYKRVVRALPNFKRMTNSYQFLNPEKPELIDISDEKDRDLWAIRLGVSIEKLKTAIKATHSLELQELKNYLFKKQVQKSYKQ